MKKLALFLSMMMAVSFTACQSQPATKSWSSASPAPESAPQSTSIQAPESSSQPEDKEAPALLYYDEGVEVTTLMSWEPGQQEVEIPFPAYDGLLAVEVREGDDAFLAGYDLETGEKGYLGVMPVDTSKTSYEYRRVLDAPGWEVKIFDGSSYRHDSWTHPIGSYTLPEALQEGRRQYNGCYNWDAQPEKDLLAWSDGDTVYLARADGQNPRPVLSLADNMDQPVVAALFTRVKGAPKDAQPVFMGLRLMNGGQTIAVDFGSPHSQIGRDGLALLNITTGEALWYDAYSVSAEVLEFLDDTTLLAGETKIDVTTGEAQRTWYWTLTDEGPLYTGNFSRYFGNVDLADGGKGIIACTLEDWNTAQPFLTANEGYSALYPFLRSAIDDRQVVCRYQKPDEEGLLLVTLPES